MKQKLKRLLFLFVLLLSYHAAIAQTVTGNVVDDTGVPLPGVSVIEKGTTNGVSTDFDGNYAITVSNTAATLEFSSIGMVSKSFTVGNKVLLNVTLEEDAQELDEVVVTALGIKKDAKALGYAVATVDNARILTSGTPANALQSLYGTVSGVQVASTAAGPAGGMKINIRNAVSFDSNSTTRPLFVVDGVPIQDSSTSIGYGDTSRDNGTGINDINPDDIASFSVLKGAKASVLYGSAGANGVVLITTKKGKKNTGIGASVSFTTSMDKAAFLPELQQIYGTGRTASNGATDDQGYYLNEDNERTLDVAGGAFGPKFDPNVQLNWWDGTKRPWQPAEQSIYDALFQTGTQTTTNLSLSSGGEKGSMCFSFSNNNVAPIYAGAKYVKNAFSLSSRYELNDNITLSYSGNYFVTKNLNASSANSFDAQGARSSLGAYAADIDVSSLERFLVTDTGYNYFSNPDLRDNYISGGRSSIINTLWDWSQNVSDFKRQHNIQSLTVDIKINDVFNVSILGGLDDTDTRNIYKGKLRDPSQIGPNSGSSYVDQSMVNRATYGQSLFNFDKALGNDIVLGGFIGGAVRHTYVESKQAAINGGMVIPNYFSFSNLPAGERPSFNQNRGEDITYSTMASVQLDYKGMLYLEAQGRNDWSSILPPDNNSFFYPGVSASWIVSKSFDLPATVKFLKIRTSWADAGRPGPRYFGNVNLGVSASGTGFIFSPPNNLPPIDGDFNQILQNENKREFEVGLESFLFEDKRLGIDFSLYHGNTYNQIMAVTAPPGWGVDKIRTNAGNVANTGWELALKTKPIFTKDFKWGLDLTFSSSKTKVIELSDDLTTQLLWSTNGLNAVAEVGGEYGLLYQSRGNSRYINPSDENDPNNGKLIVDKSGNNYEYNTRSNKKVGKLLPDLVGGVFTSFNYKDLRLVANFDYSFGATFISETETYMLAAGVLKESLPFRDQASGGKAYYVNTDGTKVLGNNPSGGATYFDGVVLDGVLADGTVNDKVVAAEDYYYGSYFSNGFFPEDRIFKSDYIALRNIALDYTLPKKITARIGLNNLVLTVFANNVAYIYKAAPNSIPEASNGTEWSSSAYGTTALPSQRSLGLSLKAKF